MPFRDVSPGARGMFEMARAPVNAFYEAQNQQKRDNLLGLQAQRMQGQLDDDAEFETAIQNKDWNTALRIDPEATQIIMAHAKQQQMSGLGEIPVTPNRIDTEAIEKRQMDGLKLAALERYRGDQIGVRQAKEARLGAPDAPATGAAPKPVELPARALGLVDEASQAIAATEASEALVTNAIQALRDGKVQLGALRNAESRARNFTGASDANSLAFADLQQTFEKIRNNYLLLAKGVQTEGDAQRAWNSEIGENVQNDNKLALQQLQKAQAMLVRAKAAQQTRINTVRANYGGAEPAQEDNDPLGLFK